MKRTPRNELDKELKKLPTEYDIVKHPVLGSEFTSINHTNLHTVISFNDDYVFSVMHHWDGDKRVKIPRFATDPLYPAGHNTYWVWGSIIRGEFWAHKVQDNGDFNMDVVHLNSPVKGYLNPRAVWEYEKGIRDKAPRGYDEA